MKLFTEIISGVASQTYVKLEQNARLLITYFS